MPKSINVTLFMIALILFPLNIAAQEKGKGGPPPAKVVAEDVKNGMLSPEAYFTGTVYFKEVSDVACEVSGRVDQVSFEEGKRVKRGKMLVKLNSELLQKSLEAARSSHSQVLAELEKATANLKRVENLYKDDSIAEQVYDDRRFTVRALEGKAGSLSASAERTRTEIGKKTIVAPFSGIVLKRELEKGEWCSSGATAAVIARDDVLDIVVDVPEYITGYIKDGMKISLTASGREFSGNVVAIIPRGDIASRTFPLKIRAKNGLGLMEGMEVKASLPVGERVETLLVSRDAVITKFGKEVVFLADDSKAAMVPVKVVGFKGKMAGVEAERLKAGMKVVTKGNERIREGQAVEIIK